MDAAELMRMIDEQSKSVSDNLSDMQKMKKRLLADQTRMNSLRENILLKNWKETVANSTDTNNDAGSSRKRKSPPKPTKSNK